MTEPKFQLHPAAGHPNEADGLTEREIADVLVRSLTGYGLDDLIAAASLKTGSAR